jgi:hypothetical protein
MAAGADHRVNRALSRPPGCGGIKLARLLYCSLWQDNADPAR